MRAAIFLGPRRIEVADRPDPVVAASTDAVVRVALGCVCGSDLWYYRGESAHALGPIGHEFVGVVEQVGAEVRGVGEGDFVIAPFKFSDGTCANCHAGWTSNCVAGAPFGTDGVDGGQGEAVRVPFADGTLVKVPSSGHSDETMRSLLTLTDVMATGHHAAVSAGVRTGSVVAVVGDGAVGLCAVIAARRLGAARIIALSRNPARQAMARSFGATDVVAECGDAAIEAALEMTDGVASMPPSSALGRPSRSRRRSPSPDPARRSASSASLTVSRCRSTPCSAATSGCAAARHRFGGTSLSSSMTCCRDASNRGACLTTRLAWTALQRRTPPWTNAARSSRSYGSEQRSCGHEHVDEG